MPKRITLPKPPPFKDITSANIYIINLHRALEQIEFMDLSDVPESTGSSVAWGDITGSLSLQSDLVTALSGKADSSHAHLIADISGLQSALDLKADLTDLGLKLYIQDSTPAFEVGEKALWIDTAGGNISFWVQDGV